MAKKHCNSKTKISFKLPHDVKKGDVTNAFSTSPDVLIEGYIGKINLIGNTKELPQGVKLCRTSSGNSGRAWVEIKN